MLVHTNTFTQAPLHTRVITQKNFNTQTLGYFYTQMPLHRHAFTHMTICQKGLDGSLVPVVDS